MIYRKLHRTWRNNYAYIPDFKKAFPELSKIDAEELCDRLIELKMDFYYEEETSVNFWVRLTLPFAIITMVLMIACVPIVFLITGKWGYSLGVKNHIFNWFLSLKLLSK